MKWGKKKNLCSVFLNCALECHVRFVTDNDHPYVMITHLSCNHFGSPQHSIFICLSQIIGKYPLSIGTTNIYFQHKVSSCCYSIAFDFQVHVQLDQENSRLQDHRIAITGQSMCSRPYKCPHMGFKYCYNEHNMRRKLRSILDSRYICGCLCSLPNSGYPFST